jgi:hypothetical protein
MNKVCRHLAGRLSSTWQFPEVLVTATWMAGTSLDEPGHDGHVALVSLPDFPIGNLARAIVYDNLMRSA